MVNYLLAPIYNGKTRASFSLTCIYIVLVKVNKEWSGFCWYKLRDCFIKTQPPGIATQIAVCVSLSLSKYLSTHKVTQTHTHTHTLSFSHTHTHRDRHRHTPPSYWESHPIKTIIIIYLYWISSSSSSSKKQMKVQLPLFLQQVSQLLFHFIPPLQSYC